MIKVLTLKDFKCYHRAQEVPLSRINVLTGLNGRGKSTVIQAILLLAQSISKEGISKLQLQGDLYSMGAYEDALCHESESGLFSFLIKTDDKVDASLEFVFCSSSEKDSAKIKHLLVDGVDRVIEMGVLTSDGYELYTKDGERLIVSELGSTEDIVSFRSFRNLTYVSADRIGPVNRSRWEPPMGRLRLDVHGNNVLSVLESIGEDRRKAIQNALSQILRGGSFAISRENDDVVLKMDSTDNGSLYLPTNVGFGYGYILSTLVALELAEPGSIFIIENPEAHLHPGAQASLTQYLLAIAQKKKLQIFVETHSDHIINECLVEINKEVFIPDDVSLLFFSRIQDLMIDVTKLEITPEGHIPSAPIDFFDQIDKSLQVLVGF